MNELVFKSQDDQVLTNSLYTDTTESYKDDVYSRINQLKTSNPLIKTLKICFISSLRINHLVESGLTCLNQILNISKVYNGTYR